MRSADGSIDWLGGAERVTFLCAVAGLIGMAFTGDDGFWKLLAFLALSTYRDATRHVRESDPKPSTPKPIGYVSRGYRAEPRYHWVEPSGHLEGEPPTTPKPGKR